MIILSVEDIVQTTDAAVERLRDVGHTVVSVSSVSEAREALERLDVNLVLLDQYLPERPGGALADDESVIALARQIGRSGGSTLGFVWLTAHSVEPRRRAMPGCLGSVSKAGDATRDLEALFAETIQGFYDERPDGLRATRVLVEIRTGDLGDVRLNIPAWKPDLEFVPAATEQVPEWLRISLRAAGGRPLYATALANLHADKPTHLDLRDFDEPTIDDRDDDDIWD